MTQTTPSLPFRMIHQSTRYLLGRRTYAVAEHCQWLIENWDQIPEDERRIIQKDVEAEFVREQRLNQNMGYHSQSPRPLGMMCDREEWQKVRNLWGGGGWIRRNV